MSGTKRRHEAMRWLDQARADLRAARQSCKTKTYEWSCFQCQQAGEKALKALWFLHLGDPWGHSLVRLVVEFPAEAGHKVKVIELLPQARRLDKLYIPTRYPNGLPDLTPSEVYDVSEAKAALQDAETIISFVAERMGSET